tara:strand:- start:745 stop:1833 length:1089 start_codon:yes stop_codon:yes gene_type:complete
MKKSFKKINKYFSKYQPTIQTFGIFLILLTIIISIWQNNLTQKQINFAIEDKIDDSTPRFELNLNFNNNQRLNDWFDIICKNYNHSLQKVNLEFLNKTELKKIEIYNKILRTYKIKQVILQESKDLFENYNIGLLGVKYKLSKSEIYSFPIIINYSYLENNKLKKTSILYSYKFQIYFIGNEKKVKSIGIEFVNEFRNKNFNPRNILLNYNLNNEIPFKSLYYANSLKLDLVKKDSMYSKIYELIEIHTNMRKEEFEVEQKDSTKLTLYFNIPKFIHDSILLKKRYSVMNKIIENKNYFKPELLSKIIQIEDSLKMFTTMTQNSKKLEKTKFGLKAFGNYETDWIELNQELLEITLDNFKIN